MKYRYLGKLCPKGHDYNGTGGSLRDQDYTCVECKKEYLRAYHQRKKAERIEKTLQERRKRHFEVWPQIVELRDQGATLEQAGAALFLTRNAISYHVGLAKEFGHYKPKKPKHTYLGSLCRRGHDFEGTGQSLRNHCDRNCVECRRQRAMEYKRRKSVNTAS